jgi:hypothetical protein
MELPLSTKAMEETHGLFILQKTHTLTEILRICATNQ